MRTFGISTLASGLLVFALALGARGEVDLSDDNDAVPDEMDNCLTDPNGAREAPNNQCDTDRDGYGNTCDADTNQDNIVGIPDFGTLVATFGQTGPGLVADFTCDGVVGIPDFATAAAMFGLSVGPSGLACAGTTPCP
jgi:hypothetical protein